MKFVQLIDLSIPKGKNVLEEELEKKEPKSKKDKTFMVHDFGNMKAVVDPDTGDVMYVNELDT